MRYWLKALGAALAVTLMSCAAFEPRDCQPGSAVEDTAGASEEFAALRKLLNADSAERDYMRALKEIREYLLKHNGGSASKDLARAKDVLAMLEALKAAQDRAEAAQKKNSELAADLKAQKEKAEKDAFEMKLLRDQINKLQLLDLEMEKKRKDLR